MYVSGDILATPCETKIVVGGVLLEARILPRLRQNTRLRMQMRQYNGHRIHTVLAGIQFRLPPSYADGATARFVTYMFEMRFQENGIEHRLMPRRWPLRAGWALPQLQGAQFPGMKRRPGRPQIADVSLRQHPGETPGSNAESIGGYIVGEM